MSKPPLVPSSRQQASSAANGTALAAASSAVGSSTTLSPAALPPLAAATASSSPHPPPPPAPASEEPSWLGGHSLLEYATFPLPPACVVRWRSFRPAPRPPTEGVASASVAPAATSTTTPAVDPLLVVSASESSRSSTLPSSLPPPPPPASAAAAATAASGPRPSPLLEQARRSIVDSWPSADEHHPRSAGGPAAGAGPTPSALLLASSLLCITTPTLTPTAPAAGETPRPQEQLHHPSPASLDGSTAASRLVEDAGEIWLFALGQAGPAGALPEGPLLEALRVFTWPGLQESSSGSFSSSDIYPAPGSASGSLSPSSSSGLSPLRPHPHLVPALPTFLRAVKERLLEAMTRADDGTVRWGEGLMLPGPSNAKDGESLAWIGGWGNSASTSIHLSFTLTLLPTLILMTPRARRVPLVALASRATSSLPSSGTPVTILPLGAKGLLLRGASTEEARCVQAEPDFWACLAGRGARAWDAEVRESSNWVVCWVPLPGEAGSSLSDLKGKAREAPTSSSDSRGLTVCWPAALVLADPKVRSTEATSYTAGLPTPNLFSTSAPQGRTSILESTTTTTAAAAADAAASSSFASTSLSSSWLCLTSSSARLATYSRGVPSLRSSEPVDRSLSIATASGSYLEAIVREREREKERAEEEKEREKRRLELPDQSAGRTALGEGLSPSVPQPIPFSAIPRSHQHPHPPSSPTGSDLFGSPSPPTSSSATGLQLPQNQHSSNSNQHLRSPPGDHHLDAMDWTSWGGGGSNGKPNAFGNDDNWSGDIGEDDFSFFDAPTPAFLKESALAMDPNAQPLALPMPPVDPASFSLSPFPNGAHGEVTPSGQVPDPFSIPSTDVNMLGPSPQFEMDAFGQPTSAQAAGFSPFSGTGAGGGPHDHPSSSPASWANNIPGRTPGSHRTPKTPFSPFGGIEEETESPGMVDVSIDPAGWPSRSRSRRGSGSIPPGFEAVPFDGSHAFIDSKYESGKFALPSPSSFSTASDLDSDLDDDSPRWRRPQTSQPRYRSKRRASESKPTLRAAWKPGSLPCSFRGFHTDMEAPRDLRSAYERLSNPKFGIVRRLQSASTRRPHQQTSGELAREHRRLTGDLDRRLRLSAGGMGFVRAEVSDEDDDFDTPELGFGATLLTRKPIRSLPGLSREADARSTDENDVGRLSLGPDLVQYFATGVLPSAPASRLPTMSTGLRPPLMPLGGSGIGVAPSVGGTPVASTPAWAPTPTSPPFGSAPRETTSEDIQRLAAWMAKEAIENPLVLPEFLKDHQMAPADSSGSEPVLAADLSIISKAMSIFRDPEDSRSLLSFLRITDSLDGSFVPPDSLLSTFSAPLLDLGHRGAVIKASPVATRFWDKLSLGPVGGRKDVLAFAVYESTGPALNAQVKKWLGQMGEAYESRGFGKHVAASVAGVQSGLLAVDHTCLSESISSVIAELAYQAPHVVFYIISPRTLQSPTFNLRDLEHHLTKSITASHSTSRSLDRFLCHLIPSSVVLDEPYALSSAASLSAVARSVYDRLLCQVERLVPRPMFPNDLDVTAAMQVPAFQLARTEPIRARFALAWPPPPASLLDRHQLLHVGYAISESGEWLVASATDERGQASEAKVWRMEGGSSDEWMVARVWAFASEVAKRAATEWRLVVCKLGLMEWNEIATWDALLARTIPTLAFQMRVYVTCSEARPDPQLLLRVSTTTIQQELAFHPPTYADRSQSAVVIYPRHRAPFSPPSAIPDYARSSPQPAVSNTTLPLSTFTLLAVPFPSSAQVQAVLPASSDGLISLSVHHLLTFTSPSSSSDVPSNFRRDLAYNFHSLAVLARERAVGRTASRLPLHLAAVETIREVVEVVVKGGWGI